MVKLIRNSIFTLLALVLTAFGLSWNKSVSQKSKPAQISATVLSAVSAEDRQTFPLLLKFAHPRLELGQYQELLITTRARAELQIMTVYPTGQINNPQTLRALADETGHYRLRFKLDDFAYLGVFQTKVLARSGDQESRVSGQFVLQTSIRDNKFLGQNDYIYPLIP